MQFWCSFNLLLCFLVFEFISAVKTRANHVVVTLGMKLDKAIV